jgi:hypothetical protein
MNYENLLNAIEAVNDNMRISGFGWSTWDSACDVENVYDLEFDVEERAIIDRAIETNGISLRGDLEKAELAEYGQNFSGGRADSLAKVAENFLSE